ncbi:MAG: hypothetical protein ACYCZY_01475 [Lacisediminihabitans sp.]
MNDECDRLSAHNANIEEEGGAGCADHHRELLIELKRVNRMRYRMPDTFVADAVFSGAGGDNDIAAHLPVTLQTWPGQGKVQSLRNRITTPCWADRHHQPSRRPTETESTVRVLL